MSSNCCIWDLFLCFLKHSLYISHISSDYQSHLCITTSHGLSMAFLCIFFLSLPPPPFLPRTPLSSIPISSDLCLVVHILCPWSSYPTVFLFLQGQWEADSWGPSGLWSLFPRDATHGLIPPRSTQAEVSRPAIEKWKSPYILASVVSKQYWKCI